MGNLTKSRLSVAVKNVRSRLCTASLFAGCAAVALVAGCIPKAEEAGPPQAPSGIDAIDQVPGSYVGNDPAIITLSSTLVDASEVVLNRHGTRSLICYTTDESLPSINEYDLCAAGSFPYSNRIILECDDPENNDAETKIVKFTYRWDNGVEPVSDQMTTVQFDIGCVPPPEGAIKMKVFGNGTVDAFFDGTINMYSGEGYIDASTGDFTFSLYVEAIVAPVSHSVLQVIGSGSGTWDANSKIMTDAVVSTKTIFCLNKQDMGVFQAVNACTLTPGYPSWTAAPAVSTLTDDTINFGLALDGTAPDNVTGFQTTITTNPGDYLKEAYTVTNYKFSK